MTDLAGKVVLVVGGGSGIGLGIARALSAEGCKVAIAARSENALKEAAQSTGNDSPMHWKTCDVADRGQVARLFEWLSDTVGPIDILVNSAGVNIANRMMANVDPADFDKVLAVNTTGAFNCMHAALPAMREKGAGLIINIVSVAGMRTLVLAGLPYCVSKFGAATLGTFVNLEEAKNGIKVTNIYPGETNTPILDKRPAPPPQEKRAQMVQPEDIAACVVTIAKLPPRAVVPELVITPPYMMMD